jgi:hypothetical protein
MFGNWESSIPQLVVARTKRAIPFAVAFGMASLLPFVTINSAPALTGAKNVAADDIGTRASVSLSYRGGRVRCGGVVFQDRYILTTAHCFTNGRGAMATSADGWEVSYWGSNNTKRDIRRVEIIMIHENYLYQEKVTYPAPKPWDDQNFPIQHQDIAVLQIRGTHPDSAISAFVAPIENEYTENRGDAWKGATWLYVYGASANGTGWRLQRALVGMPGFMDRIIPGTKPGIMNIDRKIVINTGGVGEHGTFMKEISLCSGDSGTGAFLVESNDISYDDQPDKFPSTIKLKDGHPILVGLMANVSLHGLVTDIVPHKQKRGCGREAGSDALIATRIDYYHDWIMSKTGGPR